MIPRVGWAFPLLILPGVAYEVTGAWRVGGWAEGPRRLHRHAGPWVLAVSWEVSVLHAASGCQEAAVHHGAWTATSQFCRLASEGFVKRPSSRRGSALGFRCTQFVCPPPPTGAASHFSLRPEGFGAQRLEKQGRHPESAARRETTDSGKVADDAEIHRWRGTEPLCVLDSHHTRSRLAAGTSPTATVISKGAEGQTDGQIGKPRYIQRGRDTGEGIVQSGGEGTVSSMSDAGTPGHHCGETRHATPASPRTGSQRGEGRRPEQER